MIDPDTLSLHRLDDDGAPVTSLPAAVFQLRAAWDHNQDCGHRHTTVRRAVACAVEHGGAWNIVKITDEGERFLTADEVDEAL